MSPDTDKRPLEYKTKDKPADNHWCRSKQLKLYVSLSNKNKLAQFKTPVRKEENLMPTRFAGAWTLTWGTMGAYTPPWCHSGWHGHPASLPSHPSAQPHSLSDQRSPKRLRREKKKPIQTVPCSLEALVPEQMRGTMAALLSNVLMVQTNIYHSSKHLSRCKSVVIIGALLTRPGFERLDQGRDTREQPVSRLRVKAQGWGKCCYAQRWDSDNGKGSLGNPVL